MKSQLLPTVTIRWLAATLVFAGGCDNSSTASAPTTKPSSTVTSTNVNNNDAVLAVEKLRPPSVLTIDSREVQFPAAKLALIDHRSGGFTLRLCSDDPPEAISPGFDGNSFVLDMRLATDRLEDIPASTWNYRAVDDSEALDGIFVHGNREQYRPAEVHVWFQTVGNEMVTYLTGTFLHNDMQSPGAAPQRVQVSAILRSPKPTN